MKPIELPLLSEFPALIEALSQPPAIKFPLIGNHEADAIIVNEDGTWAEWFLADRRGLAEILTDFGFDRCLDGTDAEQTVLLNPKEYPAQQIDFLRSDMESVAEERAAQWAAS